MIKCDNCGNEMTDDAIFCRQCGKPVSTGETMKENATESVEKSSEMEETPETVESVEKSSEMEETPETVEAVEKATEMEETMKEEAKEVVPENIPVSQPVVAEVQPEKGTKEKKKGKGLWIGIGVAAVIVLVVLVVCNLAVIRNSFAKMFMSSDEYCQHILLSQVEEMSAGFVNFGEIISNGKDLVSNDISMLDMHQEMLLSLHLSEDAKEDLEDVVAASEEISLDNVEFMDGLTLAVEANQNGNCYGVNYTLISDENTLATLNAIMDMEDYTFYVQIPELNEQYIAFNMSNEFAEIEKEALEDSLEQLAELESLMLTGEETEELINKIAAACIGEIEGVEESGEELSVRDLSKNCTLLEFEIDEDMMSAMLVALVESIAEEETVEEMLEGFFIIGEEDIDWEDFVDVAMEGAESVEDENISMEIGLYVDNKGEIIGYEVKETEIDIEYHSYFLLGYNKFATEIFFGDDNFTAIGIEGEGKVAGNEITGDFFVEIAEEVEFEISVRDYLISDMFTGKQKGTIILDLSQFEDLIADAGESVSGDDAEQEFVLSLFEKEIVIAFDFDMIQKNYSYNICFMEEEELYLSYDMTTQTGEPQQMEIPSSSECCEVDMESDEIGQDLEEYIENCDFDTFLSTLEDEGVPDSLMEELEVLIDAMEAL